MTQNNEITITIDNKKYNVKNGLTILQACEKFNIDIPKFCYHDYLNVAGNCRMCVVEVEKSPKPVVSCATNVMPNMKVFTQSPLVKKARESVLEFLLINHPLDCPICDQGGECDLQEYTFEYASDRSRNYLYSRRSVQDKNLGPIVKTIMTRCIHCTRCVRFIEEITGKHSLGTLGRGWQTEIGTYVKNFLRTELSGNLVDLCPVGALTAKPYAFSTRKWELNRIETVDFCDSLGSSINVFVRNKTLKNLNNLSSKDYITRVLPRYNISINSAWISDKTRFNFEGLEKNRSISFKIVGIERVKNKKFFFDFLNKTISNQNLINFNFFFHEFLNFKEKKIQTKSDFLNFFIKFSNFSI